MLTPTKGYSPPRKMVQLDSGIAARKTVPIVWSHTKTSDWLVRTSAIGRRRLLSPTIGWSVAEDRPQVFIICVHWNAQPYFHSTGPYASWAFLTIAFSLAAITTNSAITTWNRMWSQRFPFHRRPSIPWSHKINRKNFSRLPARAIRLMYAPITISKTLCWICIRRRSRPSREFEAKWLKTSFIHTK